MAGQRLSALKGRDLRALQAFRERLRAALGKTLLSTAFLSRRPIDAPADATAPSPAGAPPEPAAPSRPGARASGGAAAKPILEPAAELRVAVRVERRDLWVEERVDATALEVALETGALVSPLVCAADELAAPAARASPLAAEIGAGEEVA